MRRVTGSIAAVAAALAGCTADQSPEAEITSVQSSTLRCANAHITEVAFSRDTNDSSLFRLAVEVSATLAPGSDLQGCSLFINDRHWDLSSHSLSADGIVALTDLLVPGSELAQFEDGAFIRLAIADSLGAEQDKMFLGGPLPEGMSYGRQDLTDMSTPLVIFSGEQVTIGSPNRDIAGLRPSSFSAAFRPRDTSPNAALSLGGKMWILGGWSHFGGDDWHSYTDVWTSDDGQTWKSNKQQPPYIHYSSFVSFRGRIWAISVNSFSSADGLEWRPEAISSPALNRSVVMRGQMFNIHGSTVQTTSTGSTWQVLTTSAPWGQDREQPLVLVFRDRLWVIGGVSDYSGPNMTIHNDVWSSADGTNWRLETSTRDMLPRHWSAAFVLDDRMFLVGGWNPREWPEQNGNTGEIWYSDDGAHWLELPAEKPLPARHASFSIPSPDGTSVLLMAGYGHGGDSRMYNDGWTMKAHMFFPKAMGELSALATWGSHADGTGASPVSFSGADQLFVLRNRPAFTLDSAWKVSGAGSRIIVGDGQRDMPVVVDSIASANGSQQLQVHSNATLIIRSCKPDIRYAHEYAAVIFANGGINQDAAACGHAL